MIRVTVDAARKQALDREERRDPLRLEPFHLGDLIAQCPSCKSWMLWQSWQDLGGSCACSYRPGQRVAIGQAEQAGGQTGGGTIVDTPAPPAPGLPWRSILFVGLAIAAAYAIYRGLEPVPPQPAHTLPSDNRPQAGDTARYHDDWRMIEYRQGRTWLADHCRAETTSQTDSSRRLVVRVTPELGFEIEPDPSYRIDMPLLLRIDQAPRPYNYRSATQSPSTLIGWFRQGLNAEFTATNTAGFQIVDRFSLVGFDAAYSAALASCWYR